MLAALMLGSCAGPKVVYQQAEVLDPTALKAASSTSFLFRVPRSQIFLKPAGGESRIRAAVLDPVSTGEWIPLPFNPGFFYRVAVVQDPSGTLSREAFRASLGARLSVFPVPSCRTARLEIAVAADSEQAAALKAAPLKLELEAVATEYDYPAADGTLAYSPLYWARPRRGWFSSTKLNVVKYPNTQLVKTVNVDLEDHFAEAITVLAGIARTGIGALKGVPYVPQKFVSVFFSSLTVADNRRLAVAPLPKKGNISLHPVCGADVLEQGSTTSLEYLRNAQAAIAKAKELYDVWNRPGGR